mgnify:CR=1 FL=1
MHIEAQVVEPDGQIWRNVVAEGVEKEGQFNLLRERGCDLAQGYFIARPMPVADFADWRWRIFTPSRKAMIQRVRDGVAPREQVRPIQTTTRRVNSARSDH